MKSTNVPSIPPTTVAPCGLLPQILQTTLQFPMSMSPLMLAPAAQQTNLVNMISRCRFSARAEQIDSVGEFGGRTCTQAYTLVFQLWFLRFRTSPCRRWYFCRPRDYDPLELDDNALDLEMPTRLTCGPFRFQAKPRWAADEPDHSRRTTQFGEAIHSTKWQSQPPFASGPAVPIR